MSTASTGMPYVRLGNSGLWVSKIILGCMSYGSSDWQEWVLGEEEGIKHIKMAYDAGINTFDTADVYSRGASEVVLGKAIKQLKLPRDEIVVMTKLGYTRTSKEKSEGYSYVNQKGLSRKHIFARVKQSLENLQLDYVDVLQCHTSDYNTPIEETMKALHDVVQAGYARYIGMSSCWAWQFHAMQNYAIQNKLTPFISMQDHHNLVYREEEREMFPTLKHFGVGAITWSPLARGILTRPFGEHSIRIDSDPWTKTYGNYEWNKVIVSRVEELAKKKDASMAQIALAWSLDRKDVTAPIVGATSLEKLKELIDALHIKLTEEEMKYLEEPYHPRPIIGHV